MADEATNSTAEEIAGQVVEGSVEALALEADTSPDVVPVRDLMALKDKNEKTKAQLKEEREARKALEARLEALESKKADSDLDSDFSDYSEADKETLNKIAAKAEREAIRKLEARLAERDQKQTFEKRLDQTVAQQLEVARQNGVKIPTNVDTTMLKQLAIANPKKTVAELAESLW